MAQITIDDVGTLTTPKLMMAAIDDNFDELYGGEISTINLTGGQIAFPATAIPSADPNTLDDYEEGSWTPDVTFGGAKVGVTYTFARGAYTKIGNIIFIVSDFLFSSKGTSNGNALIEGLPFTANSPVPAACLRMSKVTFANQFMGQIGYNSLTVVLEEATEGGAKTTLTDANFANDSSVMMSILYYEI